jgi:hypothetical protein
MTENIAERSERTAANRLSTLEVVNELRQCFDVDFSVWDGNTGRLLHESKSQPPLDAERFRELIQVVAGSRSSELIGEGGPVVLLTLPVLMDGAEFLIASAIFVTRPVAREEDLSDLSGLLNLDENATANWLNRQPHWTAEALKRVGLLALDKLSADRNIRSLQHEVDQLSENLAAGYEEISLLYEVVESVHGSETVGQLVQRIADWLIDVLPSEAFAIQLAGAEKLGSDATEADKQAKLLTFGDCPIDSQQFTQLIDHLGPSIKQRPVVINARNSQGDDWPYPEVRELIVVPLAADNTVFGWLAAINHPEGKWFGTIQARLLKTVAFVLGMFSDKLRLHQQQSDILAEKSAAQERAAELECQVEELSCTLRLSQQEIGRTYEEIVLLHDVLERVKLSADLTDIGAFTIDRLLETLPVEGVAVQFYRMDEKDAAHREGDACAILLSCGKCPVSGRRLGTLIEDLSLDSETGAVVINGDPARAGIKARCDAPTLECPEIRQLIVVPLVLAGHIYGWLAAVNHEAGEELGTAEAILLSSVSALLGQFAAFSGTGQPAGPLVPS